MHPRRFSNALMLLFIQVILLTCVFTKKDGPRITPTTFDNAPSNLFYFDDTDTILLHDREDGKVYRSEDAGEIWHTVKGVEEGQAWDLWQHPHDSKVAYILGIKNTHWVTEDCGETWREFETELVPALFRAPLSFHAGDGKKVLLTGQMCQEYDCTDTTYYSKDGFRHMDLLREETRSCIFAKSTPIFKTGKDDKHDDRILCVVKGKYSPWAKDNRLVVSDDYFESEHEPYLEDGRTVQGIISMAVVNGFLVAAARAENTDELALYVTDDAQSWHRAVFPKDHQLKQDAYTILESTNYSIQIDVLTTRPTSPMGVLFTSNSNGTYFTRNIEHTNRNFQGVVDFEKISNIQGIVLVNVVYNWKEVENTHLGSKKIQSKISFDDGRTFHPLTVGKKGKELHLHSVSDIANMGRVFSSPAPGIVMGVGNTGDYLKDYEEGDLYVSDDAGFTWLKALDEAHKYEFGDQGAVIVAIMDEGPTSKLSYSINHGQNWAQVDLGEEVRARILTTTPDSTSLKFILQATVGGGSNTEHRIFAIDFDGLHERKCKNKDFEDWFARVDDDGEPSCIMGHKQFFRRRKADADCFVDEEFKDPLPQNEPCTCTKDDFECDYNFVRSDDREECLIAEKLPIPDDACKGKDDTYMGSSGFRLIPGNDCIRKGGDELDHDVERPCSEAVKKPVSGEISHKIKYFKAGGFKEWYYLERTEVSKDDDETIIMRTDTREIFITRDHGKTWDQTLNDEEITAIYPHQYFNDAVYFLTGTKTVHYTVNRGKSFKFFEAKEEPTHQNGVPILTFHPDHKDWLIWTGAEDCNRNENCHSVAYLTKDRGDLWTTMLRSVRKCEIIKKEGRGKEENLVYCEQYKDEEPDGELQLLSSDNWFADSEVHFDNLVDFATMAEFIVVATKSPTDQKTLKVDASIDGKTFADALFPKNFVVPVQKAYTLLDSSTHAVFLHVTVNDAEDSEYGSIVKSNSNGTSYVLSINGVNRNTPGYVDFEKMQGLEGVAIVNIVENIEQADQGLTKKLKTLITHNDGAEWMPLPKPEEDIMGKPYECNGKGGNGCSLHLHGYTERKDPRDTFSSPSAVGLMMGVGNVGEYLTRRADGDTFATRDGGITWHIVKEGNYMWEYGDQGSIIVIVEEIKETNVVFYSLDEGIHWTEYEFTSADKKMIIDSISTVPSDNSRNFLLWGREAGSSKDIATVNLDFTGLTDKQCFLDEENPESENQDYYLWEPKHPLQDDNCLFGHIARYHRKKPKADCYNGRLIHQLHSIARNCSCTRQDFECDFNFQPSNDGSCQLVPGFQPPNHAAQCAEDPSLTSYFEPTGYRRIPLTTCERGLELQYTSTEHACPGREKDFEDEHRGLSGFWFFVLVILLPISAAGGVGYWAWTRYQSGGWGQIRLGDSAGGGWGELLLQGLVAGIAGVWAVIKATPLVLGAVWGWVRSKMGVGRTYTSRESFANRGVYSGVEDVDELLGDEEEEGDV